MVKYIFSCSAILVVVSLIGQLLNQKNSALFVMPSAQKSPSETSISVDPNFYVFLAFGQSNMEGFSPHEEVDRQIHQRFWVMSAVDCPELGRKQGQWSPATSPLTRCNTGISPLDYFGRTLLEKLPDPIQVGVINVSVGGAKIELFDEDSRADYIAASPGWLKNTVRHYGDDPYGRLLSMAREAQKRGVVKGILLHQGESNTGDRTWPAKVKKIYDRLLKDLNLPADSVPLIAGEMVSEAKGGKCASMNPIIQTLPEYIPKAHVVSSEGVEAVSDGLHFSTAGYRELGKRYGEKMLEILD